MPNRHEVILASHRLPIEARRSEHGLQVRPSPGGLARALDDLLHEHHGTWIGFPGLEGPFEMDRELEDAFPYDLVPITMSREEIEQYYRGFANQILWPLFHDLHPYCDFEPAFWQTYLDVDRRYARTIAKTGGDHEIVWVHDYHLMMVPEMLREHGDSRPLGFFLHIPFPPVEILQRLPWHHEILESLTHNDLIGFQTRRDLENFTHTAQAFLDDVKVHPKGNGMRLELDDRGFDAAVFPISIHADSIAQQARSDEIEHRTRQSARAIGQDQLCIVGVERLDYTKGVPERLRAFQQALERYPELHGKVTLLQHINPSREEIPLYKDLKHEVEYLVGHINGIFGTMDWVPVRYSYGHLDFRDVLTLYRLGDVALITPLRDGMNLVSKEYCMARGDEGGGLILSQFAGAAEELGDHALLVNPHDIDQMAWAIHQACTVDPKERRENIQTLQERIRRHDVHAWANGFLQAITAGSTDTAVEKNVLGS